MHMVNDKQSNVINNFNEIIKAAEDFYSELYSSETDHATSIEIESEEDIFHLHSLTKPRVLCKEASRGKETGEDRVTAAWIKDLGDILKKTCIALRKMHQNA